MSVVRNRHIQIRYGGLIDMIPWYRQALAVAFGFGVILIALWSIDQGNNQYIIAGVAVSAMVTLMLLFGIEIEEIHLNIANGWLELTIPFTSTGQPRNYDTDEGDE